MSSKRKHAVEDPAHRKGSAKKARTKTSTVEGTEPRKIEPITKDYVPFLTRPLPLGFCKIPLFVLILLIF